MTNSKANWILTTLFGVLTSNFYLVFSGIAQSYNPLEWHWSLQIIYAVCFIVFLAFLIVLVLVRKKKRKEIDILEGL